MILFSTVIRLLLVYGLLFINSFCIVARYSNFSNLLLSGTLSNLEKV